MPGEITKMDRIILKFIDAGLSTDEIRKGVHKTKEELPLLNLEAAACLFGAKRKVMNFEECMKL